MNSFLSLLVALAVACVLAVPASAMPADNGPQPVAHVQHATPIAPHEPAAELKRRHAR